MAWDGFQSFLQDLEKKPGRDDLPSSGQALPICESRIVPKEFPAKILFSLIICCPSSR